MAETWRSIRDQFKGLLPRWHGVCVLVVRGMAAFGVVLKALDMKLEMSRGARVVDWSRADATRSGSSNGVA